MTRGHHSSLGVEARYGVTHAALLDAMPFHSLATPRLLRAVWALTVAAMLVVATAVVLYSLQACDAPPPAVCAQRADSWRSITSAWGVSFIVEALVDDPIFIMVALIVRRYVPVAMAYELCFKNAAVFCAPVALCYKNLATAFARCMGLG